MDVNVIATVLTGVGVLVGVWRLVDSMRRDLMSEIRALDARLSARIDGVNTRIDAVLLADRGPK